MGADTEGRLASAGEQKLGAVMTHFDLYDILGLYACLSLLAVVGLFRLGLFLRGKLRPRWRRWPTSQHPSYFSDSTRRVPEE